MKNKQNFSPHLKTAHSYWLNFLRKEDIVIDATCGNGHDSLFLSNLLFNKKIKSLFCFDIQKKAIENTKLLIKENLEKISFINDSHIDFSKFIKSKVNLIIYNLGYLPGGDKEITTMVESTIESLVSAISILDEKGAISIISYPGHFEGEKEEKALLEFLKTLDYKKFSVCNLKWINKNKAPTFFWIERK